MADTEHDGSTLDVQSAPIFDADEESGLPEVSSSEVVVDRVSQPPSVTGKRATEMSDARDGGEKRRRLNDDVPDYGGRSRRPRRRQRVGEPPPEAALDKDKAASSRGSSSEPIFPFTFEMPHKGSNTMAGETPPTQSAAVDPTQAILAMLQNLTMDNQRREAEQAARDAVTAATMNTLRDEIDRLKNPANTIGSAVPPAVEKPAVATRTPEASAVHTEPSKRSALPENTGDRSGRVWLNVSPANESLRSEVRKLGAEYDPQAKGYHVDASDRESFAEFIAPAGTTSNEKTYLNFNKNEQSALQEKGAVWDTEQGTLCVPPGMKLSDFKEHILDPKDAILEKTYLNIKKRDELGIDNHVGYDKNCWDCFAPIGSDKKLFEQYMPERQPNSRNEPTYLNSTFADKKKIDELMVTHGVTGGLKYGQRYLNAHQNLAPFGKFMAKDANTSNEILLLDTEKTANLKFHDLKNMGVKKSYTEFSDGETKSISVPGGFVPPGIDATAAKAYLREGSVIGRGASRPPVRQSQEHQATISRILNDRSRAAAAAR